MANNLCLWRSGDPITAQRLNEMTNNLNEAAEMAEALAAELNNRQSNSYGQAISGLQNGRAISTAKPQFMKQNRGVILDQWNFKIKSADECGVYVRCSGFENATGPNYPARPSINKITGYIESKGKEIMQSITTDCWGNVKNAEIELLCTIPDDTRLWSGPNGESSGGQYKFYRRLGRVVDSCFEFTSGCTLQHAIMETNDTVMPILPARGEAETNGDGFKSHSIVGGINGNSVIIKNIINGGGIKSSYTPTSIGLESGIVIVKGTISATASCNGETAETVEWCETPAGPAPDSFDETVLCVPVQEQHYQWSKREQQWIKASVFEESQPEATAKPKVTSYIKLHAKNLCNKNWLVGMAGTGTVEIPVYDFKPEEVISYEGGRGICIQDKSEDVGMDPENPLYSSKAYICNTMKLCSGCGIKITECLTKGPSYKIEACKTKLEAGSGIRVDCIDKGYRISLTNSQTGVNLISGAGICITSQTGEAGTCYTINNTAVHDPIEVDAGDGICVVQTGNKYTVSIKSSEGSGPGCTPIEPSGYTFDSKWFTITGNTVTLNEPYLNTVADGIAKNISSQINSTATTSLDTWTDETGYNGYSGTINATIVTECGTKATATVTSSSN